jgi:hypothetical protein
MRIGGGAHRQRRGNRELLERMEARNELDEVFTLAALSDMSVSNPRNRRCEFMAPGHRMVGDRLGPDMHDGPAIWPNFFSYSEASQSTNTRTRGDS